MWNFQIDNMGSKSAGLIVLTNKSNLSLDKICRGVFGKNYKPSTTHETRNKGTYLVLKCDGAIYFENAQLASETYDKPHNPKLKKILSFCDKPEKAVIFEDYDGGYTHSYGIIENGVLNRAYRVRDGNIVLDKGNLLESEKIWQNLEFEEEIDGEYSNKVYKNPLTGNLNLHWQSVQQAKTYHVMEKQLGKILFDKLWSDNEYIYVDIENPPKSIRTFNFFKPSLNW